MSPNGVLIQIAEQGAELDVWGAISPKLCASFDSFCFLQSTVEPQVYVSFALELSNPGNIRRKGEKTDIVLYSRMTVMFHLNLD